MGLGNPGIQYEKTRHNAGFIALDRLALRCAQGAAPRARFHGATLEGRIGDEPCLLLKPLNYMNRSGLAVSDAVRFYKLDPAQHLLIIVDDVALPSGAIRLRPSGGAGGHNGLRDVERLLGTEEYARCRIGVDQPGIVPQVDYVTGRFTPEQWEKASQAIDRAVQAAEVWATEGINAAMNRFNAPEAAAERPAKPPRPESAVPPRPPRVPPPTDN